MNMALGGSTDAAMTIMNPVVSQQMLRWIFRTQAGKLTGVSNESTEQDLHSCSDNVDSTMTTSRMPSRLKGSLLVFSQSHT
jgi:hypothetical protein